MSDKETTEATCARLKRIETEAGGHKFDYAVASRDVLWMVSQIRGWQTFAKRVVQFGGTVDDTCKALEHAGLPLAAAGLKAGYENTFGSTK